ncbi:MAG: hypothetical protein R3B70_42270 [Polyangiaceae bacterium]
MRRHLERVHLHPRAEENTLQLLRRDPHHERDHRVRGRRLGELRGHLDSAEGAQIQHRALRRSNRARRVLLSFIDVDRAANGRLRQLAQALDAHRAELRLGAGDDPEQHRRPMEGEIHIRAPLDLRPGVPRVGERPRHGGLGLFEGLLLEPGADLEGVAARIEHSLGVRLRQPLQPDDPDVADEDGLSLLDNDSDLDVILALVDDAPGPRLGLIEAACAVIALHPLQIALEDSLSNSR